MARGDGMGGIKFQGEHAVAITAGTTVYAPSTLFVGVGGDVTVTTVKGESGVIFKNIPSGSILPVLITQVTAASASYLVLLS